MSENISDLQSHKKQASDAFRFGMLLMITSVILVAFGVGAILYAALYSPNYGNVDYVGWSPTEARSFYLSSCASCHGDQGQGGQLLEGPALDHTSQAWDRTDEEIINIIRNGVGTMPGISSSLSDEQLQSVVNYMKQWWTEEQRNAQPVSASAIEEEPQP